MESIIHILSVVSLGSTAAYVIGAWRWLQPRWLYFSLGLVFAFVAAIAFPERDLATSLVVIVLCIGIGVLVSVLVALRESARANATAAVIQADAHERATEAAREGIDLRDGIIPAEGASASDAQL